MQDKYKTYFPEKSKCSDKKGCDNQKNIFFASGSASVNVDRKVIENAITEGFITELAFLVLLKGVYKNSLIYNIRKPKERISQLTGLSVPTVNRYFSRLGFYGLIIPQPYGWKLARIKPERKNRFTRNNSIEINTGTNVSKVKRLLFAKVLENEAKSQALIEGLYQFHRYGIDASQRNEGIKKLSEPLHASLSVRYIAKVLNISLTTAMNLIEMLNAEGVLRTWKQRPAFIFADCSADVLAHLADSYGYKYVENKALYKIDPATHYFPLSTYKAKPIDFKRYKNLMKNPAIKKIDAKIYQLAVNEYFAQN